MDPTADPVCFTAVFHTVPDDPNLLASVGQGGDASLSNTYDPMMPPAWRCDAAEGTTAGSDGDQGHGPFGLREGAASSGSWYRLPAGKSLSTAPPGRGHCGTRAGCPGGPQILQGSGRAVRYSSGRLTAAASRPPTGGRDRVLR